MKRLLLILSIIVISAMPVSASGWDAHERVPYVGTIIVKKNSLPHFIKFEVVNNKPDNRYAVVTNIIQVNEADLEFTSNDSEVAYIVSRELGEIIVKNLVPTCNCVNSSDIDAMSIDLMINGGYNPLAGVSVVTKMSQNHSENVANNFANLDKAKSLYNYLEYNYPSKILAGYHGEGYKNFLSYYQPELTERKCNKRKNKKFLKSQTKINNERVKNLAKYNPALSNLLQWDLTFELLQSITEPEEQ